MPSVLHVQGVSKRQTTFLARYQVEQAIKGLEHDQFRIDHLHLVPNHERLFSCPPVPFLSPLLCGYLPHLASHFGEQYKLELPTELPVQLDQLCPRSPCGSGSILCGG